MLSLFLKHCVLLWLTHQVVADTSSIPLYTSQDSPFGNQIEGAGIDANGMIYAANYYSPGQNASNSINTIGIFDPFDSVRHSLFFTDSDATTHFNGLFMLTRQVSNTILSAKGIENSNSTILMAADKANKRLLQLDISNPHNIQRSIHCTDSQMIDGVPNDVVVSNAGMSYLSGQIYAPNTIPGHGQVWLCYPNGTASQQLTNHLLGRTNGIALSLDENFLFFSESFNVNGTVASNRIWKLDVLPDGTIRNQSASAFIELPKNVTGGIDGIRLDLNENLYVALNGIGQVWQFNSTGQLIQKIFTSSPGSAAMALTRNGRIVIMGRCSSKPNVGLGCVDTLDVSNETIGQDFAWLNQETSNSTFNETSKTSNAFQVDLNAWKLALALIGFYKVLL